MMNHRKRRKVIYTPREPSQTRLAAKSDGFGVRPDVVADDGNLFEALLDRLPPDHQEVLDLKLRQICLEEIAGVLGKPRPWVEEIIKLIELEYEAIRRELCC